MTANIGIKRYVIACRPTGLVCTFTKTGFKENAFSAFSTIRPNMLSLYVTGGLAASPPVVCKLASEQLAVMAENTL